LNLTVPLWRDEVEVIAAHPDGAQATAGGRDRDPDVARVPDPRAGPVEAIV
jgi:hypothetical protein